MNRETFFQNDYKVVKYLISIRRIVYNIKAIMIPACRKRGKNRMQTEKITALYARFSHDEAVQSQDSNSIAHQKELLSEYANAHGFTNCRFYIDDGISGTTFDRPDFKRMVSDMENGLIGTVIVKDLSRLGRNYLVVGQYTEMIFPENNVSFIAISDNEDSANGLSDLIPFSNLMNDRYARDISKKVKAMFQQKGNSGKHLAVSPPYGYKRDSLNKELWIVDEYAAKVVKRIFDMYISGDGITKIAKILSEEKIKRPSSYKFNEISEEMYDWKPETINSMVVNQAYCGDTVNFRTYTLSYKNRKKIYNSPENYKIFYDTHPAIINRETFEKAQERYAKRLRRKKSEKDALFSGYLYCKDCKARLHVYSCGKKTNIAYECSSYRKRRNPCSSHKIYEDVLIKYVLEQIQLMHEKMKDDLPAFKKMVGGHLNSNNKSALQKIKEEISAAQNRIAEISSYVQALFESKVRNEITPDVFGSLSKKYMDEKSELNNKISNLILQEANLKTENTKLNRLFANAKKYDSISELTPEVLRDFVDHIEIEKYFGKGHTPNIEIFYVGVGLFNL